MILNIKHALFYYEHLFDNPNNLEQIKNFAIRERSVFGLELYLKETAAFDEEHLLNSTYLVKDKKSHDIVGYFSLKTGLFTVESPTIEGYFDTIPSVELSNFAVNALYRANHPEVKQIGEILFRSFILPTVQHIQNFVAVKALYIYALPEDKLISHYQKLGFSRLDDEEEKFVHSHVKPKYDADCIFMYQIL
ncbi:MAG: hypothetical protein SPK18_01785 [Treponema sp.]|nr:hypothetical protein [Spirochaetia bacterium]MDD7533640.1 hypothetical protein [Treponema sp.]MDY3722119.1 hypothetical protein [Treponema sp.]MDY5757299.1 hypothetical protein [Treponema sp.]